MNVIDKSELGKVPAVTLGFWIIKILATTLGETGGDAVTMSLNLGYLVGTAIFASIFIVLVVAQVWTKQFHPFLYWGVIVATTTVGTTLADFVDRSLGIGYLGGTAILFSLLMMSLCLWHWALGTISVKSINTPKAENLYWFAILFSQTLGTALGDWMADTGLGYLGGAAIFGAALALIAIAYFRTAISHTILFWSAFILTRPLGATIGDFMDKPFANGGLALSRYTASLVLAAVMIALIVFIPQRAESHSKGSGSSALPVEGR